MGEDSVSVILKELYELRKAFEKMIEKGTETSAIFKERCPAHSANINRLEKDLSSLDEHLDQLRAESLARTSELQTLMLEHRGFIESLQVYSLRVQNMERRIAFYMGGAAALAWFMTSGFSSLLKLLH